MEQVILHADANSYYASVECLYTPAIRQRPVAVCGSAEERHGIVLAKNQRAKEAGVKTGMAVWQARMCCPGLQVVPPDYRLYQAFSQKLMEIYSRYTGFVEPFGLDECWLDVSGPGLGMEAGEEAAHQIRRRVKAELGITVSVGVSFNKVLAKLASDMKKPDAVTLLSRENFRQRAWPLPVEALLYVGGRTGQKLRKVGIATIGALAQADSQLLQGLLGKNGVMLQAFALGLDKSPVLPAEAPQQVKSVGNSTTPPKDIESVEEARAVIYLLAESVGRRLRQQGFKAGQVSVGVRTTDLMACTRQQRLQAPTLLTGEIARAAIAIFERTCSAMLPLRSIGLSAGALSGGQGPVQMDLLGWEKARSRAQALDEALDGLRGRFGQDVLRRGAVLAQGQLAAVDPYAQTIHPVAFLREDRGVRYDRPPQS